MQHAGQARAAARAAEISYVLVPGGLQLYVGTPHSYYSIYAEDRREESGEARPFLGGFVRLCIPILDSEGRSRWPERFSAEKIEEIRRHTGPAKFDSQMMLQPRSIEEVRLDPARLARYDAPLDYREGNREAVLSIGGRRMVSASAWWDPAYGSPARATPAWSRRCSSMPRAPTGCTASAI